MTTKLYSAPGTCATAVNIALEWIGKPYEVEHIDFATMKSEAYLKINPMGVVPTLVEDDKPWREAGAILLQLADKNPDASLAPSIDDPDRSEFLYWLTFIGATLHPYFWPHFMPSRFTTNKEAEPNAVEASHILVDKALTIIDQHLEGKRYLLGDRRTVADAYLYPMASWAYGFPKSTSAYPNIDRLMKDLATDPAVQKVHELQGTKPKVAA